MKRGTEDLDFFIGDEALAAGNGPGTWNGVCDRACADLDRLWRTLPYTTWTSGELGDYTSALGGSYADEDRIIWRGSGRTRYLSTSGWSLKTTTSS